MTLFIFGLFVGAIGGAITIGLLAGSRQTSFDQDAERMAALSYHGVHVWTPSEGLMAASEYADRLLEGEDK